MGKKEIVITMQTDVAFRRCVLKYANGKYVCQYGKTFPVGYLCYFCKHEREPFIFGYNFACSIHGHFNNAPKTPDECPDFEPATFAPSNPECYACLDDRGY